jgi:N-acetylmuramic acid 6-phosphate etherase
LAVKLAMNTISTGTMVLLGRVRGNWMSWVAATNKKLIDRSARLVSELAGLDYAESVRRIFAAREEIATLPSNVTPPSPVQLVLGRIR